jgi:aryl-alcohol dehydrogenase-like predicted oxidoreductase
MRTAHPGIVLGLHRSRCQRRLLTGASDLGVEAIDTSFNYLGFRAHEVLAMVAGDLLPKFKVSTKIGYFPAAGGSEHSLEPDRLRTAVEQAARDLRREPDLVFLHNPEQTLAQFPEASANDALAGACSVLENATAQGICGSWGISSWDPRPLTALEGLPQPDVLMVRAGLLVGVDILEATDLLAERWRRSTVWGMSPFGGSTAESVWKRFDPRIFMRNPQCASPVQAAFRAAYSLPAVNAVAVGTDDLDHLRELVCSLDDVEVDDEILRQYRGLLRDRRQEV